MKLGFFTMPVHPIGRPYAETLREDREAFLLADQLGYSEAYCGEHLTDEVENIPNSMMFLASLAAATSQIRLGTAVVNLPHTHPVVAASNAAMLDNLLEGRFLMGIGAGILRSDAEALELLDADRGAMFNEAIDHVIGLWTGNAPYGLHGRFWNISTAKTLAPEMGIGTVVKPYQRPHPPILGTASDPDSQGLVALGRRGWWPISSNFLHVNFLANHWRNYAEGCRAGGHEAARANWRVARSIFVADDDVTARSYVRTSPTSPYRFYMRQLLEKLRKIGRLRTFKSHDAMPDDDVTVDYVLDEIVIAGSVETVVEQIVALYQRSGGFGTLLYCGKDWYDPALAKRSMELMATRVMPAVNSAIGLAAPAS